MRRPSAAILLATALAFALSPVSPASAKPKKATSMGCTMEQIQSPAASACIAQMEKDILAGHAYHHFVMCEGSQMMCCQGDGTRTFGCKSVAAARATGGTLNRATGGLKIAQ